MAAPIEIDAWQGDIAELEVDALVVGGTESLFMTTGPAASLKRHGGDEIERAAVAQGPIAPGGAVATGGGSLAAPYVIHAVAVGHDRVADPETVRAAIRSALAFAEPLQLHRMAFALVGTETGALSPLIAAQLLVEELADAPDCLESAVIASHHPAETRALAEALAARRTHAR